MNEHLLELIKRLPDYLGGHIVLSLSALLVGLLISVFQALTQINEATLTFVPKVLAVAAVAVLTAPFMVATLDGFARELFDRMIAVGQGGAFTGAG